MRKSKLVGFLKISLKIKHFVDLTQPDVIQNEMDDSVVTTFTENDIGRRINGIYQ